MSTFFYFLADRNTLTPAEAAALGIGYAFERSIETAQIPGGGPGGAPGIVCAEQDAFADGQLGYYPERQIWCEIPDSARAPQAGKCWVGHYKQALPTPEALARKKQLAGRLLELDDGQPWELPLARSYYERQSGKSIDVFYQVNLPQRLELAADGRWQAGSINAKYAALWELSEGWQRIRANEATDADRQRFNYQGQIDAAVLCLQANYRLGRIEASLLGLFNDDLTVEILDTLIDADTFAGLIKKKLALQAEAEAEAEDKPNSTPPASTVSATPNSSAGPAAATPITDPRGPT
jgi:hypothetical protein